MTDDPALTPEEEAARLLAADLEAIEPPEDLPPALRAAAAARKEPAMGHADEHAGEPGAVEITLGAVVIASHVHDETYRHRHVLLEAEAAGEVLHYHDARHGALSPVYGPREEPAP